MPESTVLIVLLLVLGAEFVNGFTDAPNAVATVISTRVLRPRSAILMATALNILGALAGTAVAVTIGKGIVRPEAVTMLTVAAAMVGIIAWSTLAWRYGLPTSESHALVAGLAGAGLATAGPSVLLWEGWRKVLVGIAFSTLLGFVVAIAVMTCLHRLFFHAPRHRVGHLFGKLQVLSAAFMAFGHGSNDAQKFMGVFVLTLVLGAPDLALADFHIPVWVILLCAGTMGLGTAFGGWRIIRTMGMRITKLQPVQGFAAETSAGLVIALASLLGVPLSTTHTINTAIMGIGATRRLSAVRWGVGAEIVTAWVLTFPVCGLVAWAIARLGHLLLPVGR